jgi:ankyrin repeat protein
LELLEAANVGDEEKVLALLARNADVSTTSREGRTPLLVAVTNCHTTVMRLLCEHGADADSALFAAVGTGKEVIVATLLACGADINYRSEASYYGWGTALQQAVYNEDEKLVLFLLENGADLNIYVGKVSPLHLAATRGEGITRIFLERKANIEARDSKGYTPLSYSIGAQRPWVFQPQFQEATCKLLIEAGSIIEKRDWEAMPQWYREQHPEYDPNLRLPQ